MSGQVGPGPGFQPATSRLYRAEYAAISLALLAYLVYRSLYLGGLGWPETIFWLLFPDLVAFIPIGLSRKKGWPPWGSYLYNTFHTVLLWGLAFVASWLFLGGPYWPILGWLVHITGDRSLGFGLRSNPREPE